MREAILGETYWGETIYGGLTKRDKTSSFPIGRWVIDKTSSFPIFLEGIKQALKAIFYPIKIKFRVKNQ